VSVYVQQATANSYGFPTAGIDALREEYLWNVAQLRADLFLSAKEWHDAEETLRHNHKRDCTQEWKAIKAQARSDFFSRYFREN
jgi:hypothetical protein